MEPNQTNPSPDNSGIPQGIPTGVFVPNNQTPAQTQVQAPAQNTVQPAVQAPVAPASAPTNQPVSTAAPAPAGPIKPGALDRFLQ